MTILDILGILTGFIAVMLLLSLIVTALVQATQATIRLRARNLKKGINSLIENILGESKDNKQMAAEILNAKNLAVMGRTKDPNKLTSRLKGSTVTYIDPKELPKAIDLSMLQLKKEQIDKLKSGINEIWERLELQMKKRFLLFARIIAIVWAVLVAFYFQVSAINLLNKLSVDPNLRAQYMTAATDITEEMGVRLEAIKDYQDVSELALMRLEKQYPELKESLEEVSGIGKDKDSLLEELIDVLEDEAPDAASIVESYEKILDDLYKEKTELNLEQARAIEEMLGRFSIYAWQYGTVFYIKEGSLQWNNIIGILITAILLSLGAPFWFERLKDVAKLKDTLTKVTNQNK